MSEHFNKLSPAHHELLAKLTEESSEIIQAIAKANLHGLDSAEPGKPYPTNREHIENELGELLFFMKLAEDYGLISIQNVFEAGRRKAARKEQYLHHVQVD
jgi:NTP pyrophosphatase (non-canonical NTP hydrolase)